MMADQRPGAPGIPADTRPGRRRLVLAGACLVVALTLLAGCDSRLPSKYGRRTGDTPTSVNGTGALSDMFTAAGHRVDSREFLSPNLETATTIVWFPNDFNAPKAEVVEWLEDWLQEDPQRTLVYVGRDFDAAPVYWRKVRSSYSGPERGEADINLREARSEHNAGRIEFKEKECTWFQIETDRGRRDVRTLSGPWSQGIDASKVDIELHRRFKPSEYGELLLESNGDAIVTREVVDEGSGSQLIIVTNGSFLLNMPLVNHEHRKLAGKLIDSVNEGRVVFLESNIGGPKIVDNEPSPRMHTGLEILSIWPMSAILLHFAVLGVIFCFARWPIFGTPAGLETAPASDFGLHVEALGKLLEQSGERDYAQAKLRFYHEKG